MNNLRQRILVVGCGLAFVLVACGESREADVQPPSGTVGPATGGSPTGGPGSSGGTSVATQAVPVPNDGSNLVVPTVDPAMITATAQLTPSP